MNEDRAPHLWMPEPHPPVSDPAERQASISGPNDSGPLYGTQSKAVWAAGDTSEKQVCDTIKGNHLWRFSAFGNVTLSIVYGTLMTRQIVDLQAPMVLEIPGQFTATAKPRTEEGATCRITLTKATGGVKSAARRFVTAAGGAVLLSDDAVDFFALIASTLTISGQAVVVPALQIVPLVAGSSLDTGAGFQEFVP